MNRLLVHKAFRVTLTVVAATNFCLFVLALYKPVSPFCCLKWLLLPSYLPPSFPSCMPCSTAPAVLPVLFLPICCWLWPVLLLGLSEQAQQSLFSLIWCLARSPSVLRQLGTGDVSTAPLAASSTDISSCAKHVSVTPKFSMPVTVASPATAQAEWVGNCGKNTLLCSKRDW